MAFAGKLVAVLVLSSCFLLQQAHSYPAVYTNSVYGYPSNQVAYNPYGYAQPSLGAAVGDKDTIGGAFYLECTDCSRGRRRRSQMPLRRDWRT
uniref:Uncharacterized protein n=1 Tax=Plectus sambesii TaxID=2011161 RepID=A0A914UUZ5_9BILA